LSRLGFIVNFLSRPVISGYVSAAALIIILSQVRNLLGIEGKSESVVYQAAIQIVRDTDQTSLPTFFYGAGAILFLVVFKKINSRLPSSILVVALSVLLVYLFHQEGRVKILGEIPSGLPGFQLPEFSQSSVKDLLPLALIISLVSFLESISTSKTLQTRNKGYQVDANSELI